MLTGYNTDIKHQGTIFHIQTEDGGESNPVIVSLVYQGGRILASKKTSYAQIVGSEDLMSQLRIMLEDQHRAMIRAVKTGTLPTGAEPEPSSGGEEKKAHTAEPEPPVTQPEVTQPERADKAPPHVPKESKSIKEKNLDQVILEYLASEMDEE